MSRRQIVLPFVSIGGVSLRRIRCISVTAFFVQEDGNYGCSPPSCHFYFSDSMQKIFERSQQNPGLDNIMAVDAGSETHVKSTDVEP